MLKLGEGQSASQTKVTWFPSLRAHLLLNFSILLVSVSFFLSRHCKARKARKTPSNRSMSAVDFLVAQTTGGTIIDLSSLDLNQSLAHPPQPCLYDYDASDQALPYPLSGPSEHKHYGVPFANQFGTEENLSLCNTGHEYPLSVSNVVFDPASRSSFDVETPPSSVQATPNTRKQQKHEATKVTNSHTKGPKETKAQDRRENTRERNRVAASSCRKRKKRRTETLEEKNSCLEATHSHLQGEHGRLLQEVSRLKNLLVCHASCQDPNIDGWIKNEASKYVHNLHSP